MLASCNERGTITHLALDISLSVLFCSRAPLTAEIPSTRIYLQGRMLER